LINQLDSSKRFGVDDDGDYSPNIGGLPATAPYWNSHKVYGYKDIGTQTWETVLKTLMGFNYGLHFGTGSLAVLFDNADFPTYEPKDINLRENQTGVEDIVFNLLATSCHGLYRAQDSLQYTVRPFGEVVTSNQTLRDTYRKNLIYKPDYFGSIRSEMPGTVNISFRYTDAEESLEVWTVQRKYGVYYPGTRYPLFEAFQSVATNIWVPNRVHFSDWGTGGLTYPYIANEAAMAEKLITLYYDAWEYNHKEHDATYFGVIPFIHCGETNTLTYYQDVDGYKTSVKSINMLEHKFPVYDTGYHPPKKPSIIFSQTTSTGTSQVSAVPVDTGDLFEGWGFPITFSSSSSWKQNERNPRTHFVEDAQVYPLIDIFTLFDANHPKLTHINLGFNTISAVKINRPGTYEIEMEAVLDLQVEVNVLSGAVYLSEEISWYVLFDEVSGQSPTGRFPDPFTKVKNSYGKFPKVATNNVSSLNYEWTQWFKWTIELVDPDNGVWAPGWFIDAPGGFQQTVRLQQLKVHRIK
jgi:hypothetical protein